jgi:hypothetical protein
MPDTAAGGTEGTDAVCMSGGGCRIIRIVAVPALHGIVPRWFPAKMTAIIKSPVPFVPVPEMNVFSFLFPNPGLSVPGDHIVTIDALTGMSRTRAEHVHRVRRLATALTTPRNLGGLEIPPQGERVGILSEGNVVRICSIPSHSVHIFYLHNMPRTSLL